MLIASMLTSDRLREAAETALGLVLAVTPLALWIARTPETLLLLLAIAGASVLLLIALWRLHPDDETERAAWREKPVVPDDMVEELHEIFPLTYHHSLREAARFRRVMQKLRARLD